jgi:Spx/MgsR family transcriptional regulator
MVRNAMKWLTANDIAFEFVDYRRDELDPAVVDDWFERAGWETVFNRNSTAYRKLPEASKAGVDATRAKALIFSDTNLIKRPVLDTGDTLLFGFKADTWAQALGR